MVQPYAEGSAPASKVHALNQQLIHCLVIGLRTAELHERGNAMVESAVMQLYRALDERLGDFESVSLSARNQCLFVERERVRVTPTDYLNVRYLMRKLEDWDLPGICFNAGVTPEELRDLLFFLGRMTPDPGVSAPWEEARGIEIESASVESSATTETADDSLRAFAAAVDISRSLNTALSANQRLRQRSLRRVSQTLVDLLLQDENALIAMTSIKNFDGYLFNHCANVAVLSAALGQRLGLHKARLGELCLAALLHDLGKTMTAKDILDKTDPLTEHDWEEIRQHPVHSVEILLAQGILSPGILAAVVAGFEHHLNFDLSGYPTVVAKHSVTLAGRIITIADCYDAITTPRPYRDHNLTPHDGIRFLLAHAGTKFDPVLVKLFVELLGVYPPGTVVRLSTGQVGIVSRGPGPGMPLDRPLIHFVTGEGAGTYLDLGADQGADAPKVTHIMNPDNQGLLPALDMAGLEPTAPPADCIERDLADGRRPGVVFHLSSQGLAPEIPASGACA